MTLDWARLADITSCSDEELYRRGRLEQALAGRAQEPPQPTRSDPPPEPESGQKAQGYPSMPSDDRRPQRAPDPVDVLSAALDAAASDADRAALLAAAPRDIREQLRVHLIVQAFMRAEDDPYADFDRALAAAVDDCARRSLIAQHDAAFLAEWSWRMRATVEDWQRRYIEMIDEPP